VEKLNLMNGCVVNSYIALVASEDT